jgi:hypothetical protein
MALVFGSIANAQSTNVATLCADGMARIQSYNVVYALDMLNIPSPGASGKAAPPTAEPSRRQRDAFAFGLGRRVEDFLGTAAEMISVTDWRAVTSGANPRARLLYGGPGDGYLQLVDPICWGCSLTELLRDANSRIETLDGSSVAKGMLEVHNPELRGPIRIWADPEHGYLPSIVECYQRDAKDQTVLNERTRVTGFVRAGGSIWVPVKSVYELWAGSGREISRTSLVVDVEKSSWNTITTDELFTEARMPPVNWARDAYKVHLPPAQLEAIRTAERAYNAAMAQVLSRGKVRRLLVYGASALVVVAVVVLLVRRRIRRTRLRRGQMTPL